MKKKFISAILVPCFAISLASIASADKDNKGGHSDKCGKNCGHDDMCGKKCEPASQYQWDPRANGGKGACIPKPKPRPKPRPRPDHDDHDNDKHDNDKHDKHDDHGGKGR